MKLVIKSGTLIDPGTGVSGDFDLLIEGGRVSRIERRIALPPGDVEVVDAKGKIVTPGLVDIHVHLREPGGENSETIASGTRAALAGGFTSILAMANTNPPIDSVAGVKFIITTALQEGVIHVYPAGTVTKGRRGEDLSEIGKMYHAGIMAVSDDGSPVSHTGLMRRALEYTRMFPLPVISHCEDLALSSDGVMNEGEVSLMLGLKGIPRQAEEVMVARDIALAELTGGRLHIAHVSTAGSVELIRIAKRRGLPVTCEVCPHHFTLTEEAVKGYDPNTKMKPPLRSARDVEEVLMGLKDGTIDCIASDHAPHPDVEKEKEFDIAPFGIIGMETMLPLAITRLYHGGVLPLQELLRKLSLNPARIAGIEAGGLFPGAQADISIIDLEEERTISRFHSKSRNSPFTGWRLRGFAHTAIVAGRVALKEGTICS